MSIEICTNCERAFYTAGNARFCPICRKERLSELAKERGLNRLGNLAYSQKQKEKREEENG